jgi:hypothetical protein
MPDFLEPHPVPAAELTCRQQKVNRARRRRSMYFGVVAAFGMGLQSEVANQLLSARVHGENRL